MFDSNSSSHDDAAQPICVDINNSRASAGPVQPTKANTGNKLFRKLRGSTSRAERDVPGKEEREMLLEGHNEQLEPMYGYEYYGRTNTESERSQSMQSDLSMNDLDGSFVQRAYRREQLSGQGELGLFSTILAYVFSDIKKKHTSFSIGVFTVFMVVCFIIALKGLIDVAPIALLKVA